MSSTDCYNCDKYPCGETELIHQYIKDNELNLRVTLNGCENFSP